MLLKNQNSESRKGIVLVCCAAALWGTVGVATEAIYRQSELSAIAVGFYRLAIAFLCLAPLGALATGAGFFRIARRDLLWLALIGGMLAAYQVFYFSAIRYTGVAIATLVTLCTAPVIVALLSRLFLQEALTRRSFAALFCALAGTICLVGTPRDLEVRSHLLLGVALALGSATGYALVALLGRKLAGRYHPLQGTTLSFGAGALVLLPLAGVLDSLPSHSPATWGLLVYVGLVPSALSYTLFFVGIRYIRATAASILTLIEPLTATLLAWLLFDERLGVSGIFGAALLAGSIALLYRVEQSVN
jgi:DME family drug/metabolite transporter